jgi:hypothetical protein
VVQKVEVGPCGAELTEKGRKDNISSGLLPSISRIYLSLANLDLATNEFQHLPPVVFMNWRMALVYH